VDNHASILLRIKNTCGIRRKVAIAHRPLNRGQLVVRRTASEHEVQKQEILLLPTTLQLHSNNSTTTLLQKSRLQLLSATPAYDSSLQLRSATLATSQEELHQQSLSNQEKYCSQNSTTVLRILSPSSLFYLQPQS
jgi:hypothetical protein